MATKTTGWKCTHSASVIAKTDTTATIRVYAYWQNDGWTYDINYVSAWVYCGSSNKQVLSSGSIDAESSSTQRVTCGYADFVVNKTTAAQNISCYAKITSNSSYVSGTKSSTAANVSVTAKTSYIITYNANGGSGAPGNQTKWYGTDLTLSSTKPTRTGYSFQGWSTANDSSVEYAAGAKYTANAGVTLYAVWKANTYTVKYDANGGSGAPDNQTKTYGVNLTLSTTKPTRVNYKFLGWATTSTATTATYAAGGTFTTNATTTLYAVWELAYVKPDIYNVTVERYAFDGTNYTSSDNGKYALVSFEYRCFETITSVLEIKIEWENSSKTEAGSVTVDATDPNGSITEYIGENTLNADSTYTIRIIVRDNVDYSVYFVTLNGSNIPVDVLMDDAEGPKGISFGKPAELPGKADFGYEIYPRNGIANILLEPDTDLNDVLTPNTYIGENVSAYNYQNCPVTSGTFSLEVVSGGPDGQVIQTLTVTSQTSCIIYQRHYHRVDGEWMWAKDSSGNYIWNCIYSAQGKLLWSGAWYMNATQSSVLSEPISYQPSGIVLVFSMYNNTSMKAEDYAWNEFFVPKQVVQRHGGKGHSFLMSDATAVIAAKYLYIYDDHIDGYTSTENVNVGNDRVVTANGITYKNSSFVLRYVFGV